jgi:hypothetical protein
MATMNLGGTGTLSPENEAFDTFCHMVVEEFLMRKNLTNTLEEFRQEWSARPEEDTAMLSWYEVAMRLRLPDVVEEGSKDMTVLENMSNAIIKESSVRARRSAEMTAQGLAVMPKKKPLPEITQVRDELESLSGTITAGKIDEDSLAEDDDTSKRNDGGSVASSRTGLHSKKSANASVKALQELKAEKAEERAKAKADEPKVSRAKSHVTLSPEAAAIVQRELDKAHDEELKSGKSRKPKVSNENWIPDLERTRSLERDFKVLKNNLSDVQLREMQERREMKQFMVSDLEKARNAESLGQTKRRQCGCCLQEYLPINLPLKVSQKAVLDIRVKWGGKLTSKTVFGGTNPPIGEYLATSAEPSNTATPGSALDGTAPTAETQSPEPNKKKSYLDKLSERLSVVPRCYSDVPVCTFCAQFFQDQDEYRPSYGQIVRSEKKSVFQQTMAKEKEYWDPLTTVEKERAAAIQIEEAAIAAGLTGGASVVSTADGNSVAGTSVGGDGASASGSV